jgi:hypothetical protein
MSVSTKVSPAWFEAGGCSQEIRTRAMMRSIERRGTENPKVTVVKRWTSLQSESAK